MLRTRNKKILKKKKSIKESDSRWCDRLISIFNVSKGIEGIYKEEEEGDEKFSSFNHSRLLCPDVEKSFWLRNAKRMRWWKSCDEKN